MDIIKVKKIVKKFNNRIVLDNVTLNIKKGEIFVVIGQSGSGKSTLIRAMIGALPIDKGSIFVKNKNINKLANGELDALRKNIGMVFQGGALFNSMTVGDNVALPLKEHTDLKEETINIIVKMMLEIVGLSGFEKMKPAELSGGMKKRVGLARAIVFNPELVFYDEPGAGLDPITTAVIDKLILDLNKKMGITSVIVTHKMQTAFRIADRIAMIHEGKLLEVGTVKEIKNSKDKYVQNFINGSAKGVLSNRKYEDIFNHIKNKDFY
jgi:phospholipid/cholesterol/gamma-HCH transport system ATP-binding protein